MARDTLAVTEINLDGIALAADAMIAAHGDGFEIMNDGAQRTFFMCLNGSEAPITLTIQTYATRDGLPLADRTYEIAAGQRLLVCGFRPHVFNRPNGTIWVDFSDVSQVTFGAYKLAG